MHEIESRKKGDTKGQQPADKNLAGGEGDAAARLAAKLGNLSLVELVAAKQQNN